MEELESPMERLEDDIHEIAERAGENWLRMSALISALFAVLAAVSGLQSGHAANAALLEQISASNSWNYYQAKGIKSMLAEMKPGEEAEKKAANYRDEQQVIKLEAEAHGISSEHALQKHELLASAVTFFQVAIAITAISVLTRRKHFLAFSVLLGALGAFYFVRGMVA